MKEKVYTIPSTWDMTIVEGVADYKGLPHHFYSLDTEGEEEGFFSDRYSLTPLTSDIFDLEMKSWSYWLRWLEMLKKGIHLPHSNDYSKLRKEKSYDEITFDNPHFTETEKKMAEQNYQWELTINNYLETTTPLPYQVRGNFQGSTDFSSKTENLLVQWKDLLNKPLI